jgi:uncharacterized protein
MVRDEILVMLRCPEDRSTLTHASGDLLERINRAIPIGQLRNRAGRPVEKPLDGGLVRAAGDLLYPVVDQIPVMLLDEAIPLDQLNAKSTRQMEV